MSLNRKIRCLIPRTAPLESQPREREFYHARGLPLGVFGSFSRDRRIVALERLEFPRRAASKENSRRGNVAAIIRVEPCGERHLDSNLAENDFDRSSSPIRHRSRPARALADLAPSLRNVQQRLSLPVARPASFSSGLPPRFHSTSRRATGSSLESRYEFLPIASDASRSIDR